MDLLTNNTDQVIIDENKDYLSEYVGEGKKYRDAKELAKAYFHADNTLAIKDRRMDELRSDLDRERKQNLTRENLQAVLEQFGKANLASSDSTPNANTDTNVNPTIDPNQIKTLVSSEVMNLRKQETEASNAKMVEAKLIERYGNNYANVLSQQAVDLGLNLQEVNAMAKTNPKVFMRTFGLDQPVKTENFQAPVRNSFNFAPTSGPKRTWTYYQEIRKNKPEEYYSPKIQNQMVEDYNRLGDAFEDGNFHQYN